MLTCRTCRGDYERSECLCPHCKKPLGTHSGRLCRECGKDTGERRMCPRCYSDVAAWERESLSMMQFLNRGGLLGMLPSFHCPSRK